MAASTSTAKQNIMQRLGAVSALAPANSNADYTAWQAQSSVQRLARFKQGLLAAHAEVLSLPSASQLVACLLELYQKHHWQSAMCGVGGEWHSLIKQVLADKLKLTPFEQSFEQYKQSLFETIQVTFSACDAGIADTGSLVLKPSADEPRSLSLIAPCHVAVIKASQIVDNFTQLMLAQNWRKGLPSNVVLISGPSKTADIQQTLAYGAHGPSELIVIVLEDE